MRSTATQICPALAKAPEAACSAAHTGSTSASTISGSLPPSSRIACAPRPAQAVAISRPVAGAPRRARAPRAGGAGVQDGGDVGMGDERAAGAAVALQQDEHVVGQLGGE